MLRKSLNDMALTCSNTHVLQLIKIYSQERHQTLANGILEITNHQVKKEVIFFPAANFSVTL